VVFSYWTYTLDLVQEMLDAHGIAYTRIDGKTSLLKRSEAIGLFEKEGRLRVLLVSITCGGAGYSSILLPGEPGTNHLLDLILQQHRERICSSLTGIQ